MKTKILLILFLGLTTSINAIFRIKVKVNVIQSDAVIYLNNEYKGKDSYEFELREAKPFILRIEKKGFITEIRTYKYKAKINSGFFSFDRNDLSIIIDLKEESTALTSSYTTNKKSIEKVDRSTELTRLETLKSEGLLNPAEALEFKDVLLSGNDTNISLSIDELMKLRKQFNTGLISKDELAVLKSKIVRKQYDFSPGNTASEKIEILKGKADSGDYTKAEIEELKKKMINSYR